MATSPAPVHGEAAAAPRAARPGGTQMEAEELQRGRRPPGCTRMAELPDRRRRLSRGRAHVTLRPRATSPRWWPSCTTAAGPSTWSGWAAGRSAGIEPGTTWRPRQGHRHEGSPTIFNPGYEIVPRVPTEDGPPRRHAARRAPVGPSRRSSGTGWPRDRRLARVRRGRAADRGLRHGLGLAARRAAAVAAVRGRGGPRARCAWCSGRAAVRSQQSGPASPRSSPCAAAGPRTPSCPASSSAPAAAPSTRLGRGPLAVGRLHRRVSAADGRRPAGWRRDGPGAGLPAADAWCWPALYASASWSCCRCTSPARWPARRREDRPGWPLYLGAVGAMGAVLVRGRTPEPVRPARRRSTDGASTDAGPAASSPAPAPRGSVPAARDALAGASIASSSSSMSGIVTNSSSSCGLERVVRGSGAIGRSSRMMPTSTVSAGKSMSPTRLPTYGRLGRQRQLDHGGLALLELEDPHEVADADGLLDQRRHQPRRGHGDVDAPGLVEHPLVLGVVDPRDRPRARRTRSWPAARPPGWPCRHRSRRRRRRTRQAGLVQGRDLAGVGEQPLGLGHAGGLDGRRSLVDQQHLVAVVQQLAGDGRPTLPAPAMTTRMSVPSLGARHGRSARGSRRALDGGSSVGEASTRWSRSPSWKTVSGVGHDALAEPGEVGAPGRRWPPRAR